MKIKCFHYLFACVLAVCFHNVKAQSTDTTKWWHNKIRNIHYKPGGRNFVLQNGSMRFNRALYGTNTGFRVEAGDLPEFALYLPGMGGNFKFGLIAGDKSKWLINSKNIKTTYRPGSMVYEIRDTLLGNGVMHIVILALADAEGMIIRTLFSNVPSNVELLWVYGGATGKRFNRDGDVGADLESSFDLKPDYCKDNIYKISNNSFRLLYGSGKALTEEERYGNKPLGNDEKKPSENNSQKELVGIVPPSSSIQEVDAMKQSSPSELFRTKGSSTPAIAGNMKIYNDTPCYFLIVNPASKPGSLNQNLTVQFDSAENARIKLFEKIKVNTPDPYINTLGGALSIAADAIWEDPSFMHGAIAWRMRLNGWRGAYAADPLGWHDRARMHFSSYALSQVTSPESGPVVADTALNLARQLEKMGTSVFSSGYISRNPGGKFVPHHYDMNLVFFDQLLNHFNWTGDIEFVKQMWPLLKRHLAWEKRNFDPDDDGLYDAYAAIWASDALQYSGGGVTHSSAYNYRSNKMAAEFAKMIGEDPLPYQKEADKILHAINSKLWISSKGWYAEFKDMMGLQNLHAAPGLWTIYHAIDEKVANPFQAYQALRYIDNHIPHIPIKAIDFAKKDLYVLSTTNWHPYEWSLNNVALAESQHTALAYWKGGRNDEAFKIWESSLIESMYLGASPGGFQQLTFYDAIRGELYRDFADGIGMTSRTLTEGLFGINPDALNNTLTIQPGWPMQWDHASLAIPDLKIDFKRNGYNDTYTIEQAFEKKLQLKLLLRTKSSGIKSIMINDKPVSWKNVDDAIGDPIIEIKNEYQKKHVVKVGWQENKHAQPVLKKIYVKGDRLNVQVPGAFIQKIYDPQNILLNAQIKNNSLQATENADAGSHTAFVQVKQGGLIWWEPLDIIIKDILEIVPSPIQSNDKIQFVIKNNLNTKVSGVMLVNYITYGHKVPIILKPSSNSDIIEIPLESGIPGIPSEIIFPGSNIIHFILNDIKGKPGFVHKNFINWKIISKQLKFDKVDLSKMFNDKVTQIFKNQYLSPRPKVPTLQLPTQGIGEWTHPKTTANIDDRGLRKLAGEKNEIALPQGIPFQTPSDTTKPNIIFTSRWDNYPKEVVVPLSGNASHAYLLMAGSTNPMQSRVTNGVVYVIYEDGTSDSLLLINPESWWPIEQDYYEDGYAFHANAPKPVRIHLKTGEITSDLDDSIAKYNGKKIDGGAATVLDMPLDESKTLKEIRLVTLANDVVIGLMSVTLVRP